MVPKTSQYITLPFGQITIISPLFTLRMEQLVFLKVSLQTQTIVLKSWPSAVEVIADHWLQSAHVS